MSTETPLAHPPATLEGWYALHQIFRAPAAADSLAKKFSKLSQGDEKSGWSVTVNLIGSVSDLMLIHFRLTLDEIGAAQREVAKLVSSDADLTYSFLSMTEAGLYHITAELSREAAERDRTGTRSRLKSAAG